MRYFGEDLVANRDNAGDIHLMGAFKHLHQPQTHNRRRADTWMDDIVRNLQTQQST